MLTIQLAAEQRMHLALYNTHPIPHGTRAKHVVVMREGGA